MRPSHLVWFAISVLAPASSALAFEECGRGRAVECYEKVRLPDVYAARMRSVVVRPAMTHLYRRPAEMSAVADRIEIAPARWDTIRRPAVWETRTERILVRPAQTTYVEQAAVTKVVRETVVVQPATVRWERSRGVLGRGERMCKVVVPAVTREVAREVVVPARRIPQTTPAVYESVSRRVLVSTGGVDRVYRPAVRGWVTRPVMLKPARDYVVETPPVIALRHENVFVRPGGYGWRRTR